MWTLGSRSRSSRSYVQCQLLHVHVVWNPKAAMNRAETALLEELLRRIEATPIEARTYI